MQPSDRNLQETRRTRCHRQLLQLKTRRPRCHRQLLQIQVRLPVENWYQHLICRLYCHSLSLHRLRFQLYMQHHNHLLPLHIQRRHQQYRRRLIILLNCYISALFVVSAIEHVNSRHRWIIECIRLVLLIKRHTTGGGTSSGPFESIVVYSVTSFTHRQCSRSSVFGLVGCVARVKWALSINMFLK